MNAGAYDGEMKDVIISVSAVDLSGCVMTSVQNNCSWGIAAVFFRPGGYIVLSAQLKLEPGDPEAIFATMAEYARRRRDKQPLDMPSAGSTFKRPKGLFVGPLLEQLGLKASRSAARRCRPNTPAL